MRLRSSGGASGSARLGPDGSQSARIGRTVAVGSVPANSQVMTIDSRYWAALV